MLIYNFTKSTPSPQNPKPYFISISANDRLWQYKTTTNGDGLIDIVYGRDNDKKAYLNNGSNWVESSNLARL
jgi:hypothetical protein